MGRILKTLAFCTTFIGVCLAFSQVSTATHKTRSGIALSAAQGGDFGELTSALATLDQQWQIQQQSSVADGRGKPRWSKMFLPKEESDGSEETNIPFVQPEEDYVWMLEPPANTIPSCVVVFTGGAGLGQFPQVAYNELLSKISDKLNAVCITAPYEVGLDHFSLAKQTGERIRRALLVLNDGADNDDDTSTSLRLPTYSLAHSLGCKLQTIYMAATGLESSFDGMGFMAYNNFSFSKTISMARTFAQELRGGMGMGNMGGVNPEMLNSIFDFAEMAVGAIGVDFSPNSEDTERLIQLRYKGSLQSKTRVFVFDEDNLDSSNEFQRACQEGSGGNDNLKVSHLPGGHLTPVFFRWNVDELAKAGLGEMGDNLSPDDLNMAKEAMGGFQGASFGDETAFNALVDEVCDWILGKPPSTASIPKLSSSSSA